MHHTRSLKPFRPLALAVSGSLFAAISALAADQVPLDDGKWELSGQGATVETHLGRPAIKLATGRAFRRELSMLDGTIDVDVALTGERSFVYVQFRLQADGEHEEFYLRPHKSNLPDALQYSPVIHSISSWQLFHGPGGTAAVPLPVHEWVHVRLVLQGRQAAVFVGDSAEPQLVVPRLAREPAAGYLALRGFVPNDSQAPHAAYFSNLTVRSGHVPFDFSKVTAADPPAGVVSRWRVSPNFVPADGPIESLPALVADASTFETLDTEPSGLLLLPRYRGRPQGAARWSVVASLDLEATEAGTRRLELGYSDEVSVFLNGRLLFVADDSYSYDVPRREGLIGLDQAALYLPLIAGTNRLELVVTDGFGGAGLIARVADRSGLSIRP